VFERSIAVHFWVCFRNEVVANTVLKRFAASSDLHWFVWLFVLLIGLEVCGADPLALIGEGPGQRFRERTPDRGGYLM
jgi:hypothetical protein